MKGLTILAVTASFVAATTTIAQAFDQNAASDQNLRFSRAYIERAFDQLSHDQSDYGGHRVAAMNDIAQAREDLTMALRFDSNKADAVIPTAARPEDTDLRNFERGQVASDQNLEFVRRYLERAIDMLQHDAHDYGGFRVKAITALGAAREQLVDAIQFRDAHRMTHEPAGTASDENLRFTRLYLNRAVTMLQHDARDYAGHRAAAVADIMKAQADLTAALRFDANKEDAVLPTRAMAGDEDLESFFVRGEFRSNENIEFVRRYVERGIDMLQRDTHDYGGFRAKAIVELEAARAQLALALKST